MLFRSTFALLRSAVVKPIVALLAVTSEMAAFSSALKVCAVTATKQNISGRMKRRIFLIK